MTTQNPAAAPRTQLINLRRALDALDAGEHGAWASHASVPKRELARPKGRSPVSATDLARAGVAAAPTKKAAKIKKNVYAQKKGDLSGEKSGAGEAKKSG